MQYSIPRSEPLTLSASTEMKVYALFAFALGLTVLGVFIGTVYAPLLYSRGLSLVFFLAMLGIVFTAHRWMNAYPWNYLLFGALPLISGTTIAPFLWHVSANFANGNAILLNALIATTFMVAAAAVFARTTSLHLAAMSRFLLFAILGLIGFGLLQLFVPALRQSVGFEMALSGAGVLVFAGFTAFDVQRIQTESRMGMNPFLLALNLYLDIFNLFVYIIRFMLVIAGDRR